MVSGKVISKEKQEVVDFATVYLKGTTYGCTTNEEGIYHLHAPAGKYTLVVSAIGYVNPEKPDVPLNKNDAFQKVQKRRVQEKR